MSVSQERLNTLVEAIKRLNPTEYEELFKLLHQNKCEYTRNNNGVFLNLTWLNEEIIKKIELFVQFCYASRKEIQHYEKICEDYYEIFSGKGDKDANNVSADINVADNTVVNIASIKRCINPAKVSSTMKFYLLKKKFAKINGYDSSMQTDLEKETYLL